MRIEATGGVNENGPGLLGGTRPAFPIARISTTESYRFRGSQSICFPPTIRNSPKHSRSPHPSRKPSLHPFHGLCTWTKPIASPRKPSSVHHTPTRPFAADSFRGRTRLCAGLSEPTSTAKLPNPPLGHSAAPRPHPLTQRRYRKTPSRTSPTTNAPSSAANTNSASRSEKSLTAAGSRDKLHSGRTSEPSEDYNMQAACRGNPDASG